MIWVLARETSIEIAGKDKIRIELVPIGNFRSQKGLFQYCEKKGWKRSGSDMETEFIRELDMKQMKKQLKSYFSIEQAFKIYERFIILEQDLMG
ncbi:hypothetical protein JWG45_07335 [Leptospira sp. 201903070]|uniref:Uncharacterized protein n=1 Tax=Leptospira ainlahdjerensis TaxID=2810033 RepID=A0ABS2UB02_9LEPT|nr:hypothetical protein [Leptospira ainlahdjerensis]MBM9576964.1 hypothetical protein [Leptospira ainlahdjerensis]